jgi:hypothetical protein
MSLRTARDLARTVREVVLVLGVAVYVEVGLRRHSIDVLASRLGLRLDLDSPVQDSSERAVLPRWAKRPARAVDLVARLWPFGDTCLRRCLMMGFRLRSLQPVLKIGVRLEDGRTYAHSWLEIGGRSLDGSGAGFVAMGYSR